MSELSVVGDGGEVEAAGGLEDSQVEEVSDGDQVVEDLGLDGFVFAPGCGFGEGVDFDGEAVVGGGQGAHQQGHAAIVVDVVAAGEVALDVEAEDFDVGDLWAIQGGVDRLGAVFEVGVQAGNLLFDGVLDQINFAVALEHFRGAEFDGEHVDDQGAFDAPPARFLHAAPVPVGDIDNLVGGNDGDGHVEIADFDGVQADVEDVAVGVVAGDFDPVAFFNEVVGGNLHAGDDGEDGVLEDEQQDGGEGTQAGQQDDGGFAGDQRDAEDQGDGDDQDFDEVEIALDGDARIGWAGFVDGVEGIQQGIDRQGGDPGDEDEHEVLDEDLIVWHEVGEEVDHQEGGDPGNPVGFEMFDEDVVPFGFGAFGDVHEGTPDDEAADDEGQDAEEDDAKEGEQGVGVDEGG